MIFVPAQTVLELHKGKLIQLDHLGEKEREGWRRDKSEANLTARYSAKIFGYFVYLKKKKKENYKV